jgi:hypothetical protein
LQSPERRERLRDRIGALRRPDAARAVAERVVRLLEERA